MADDLDRPRLTGETLDRIRARMTARVNLGVEPTSPVFLDAVNGSIFGDLSGPTALELDEAYDFADLVARACIPLDSYGDWLDDWAESFGLERKDQAPAGGLLRFTGTPGTNIAAGTQATTSPPPDADPIAFQVLVGGQIPGGGQIDLEAQAVLPGTTGNVPAGTVTVPAIELPGVASITNPASMTGGADVESDEQLNARLAEALSGDIGAGTQADYRRWLLSRAGVGFVTVRPVARGPGTVDIYATDLNNDPLPPAAIAGHQAWLDPVSGQGLGQAPIGHDALVLTPGTTGVTIVAVVAHETGYSLDGAGGTRATRQSIIDAVERYVNALDVGEDVVRNKVIAAMVGVRGVFDVSGVTINGGIGDLAIADGNVADTTAVNLT